MTVEYITYQLIAGYGNDEEITGWLDSYDFYGRTSVQSIKQFTDALSHSRYQS
jgi:hypothetical protein